MLLRAAVSALSLSAFSLLALAGVQAQQSPVTAHVLDVKGEWRVDGTTTQVKAGQGLNAGARVVAVSSHAGDAITLVRDEDMSRRRVSCDGSTADPCRTPIVIADPAAPQSSGLSQVKGMLQAALSVLLNKPPEISSHYAMTLSRGADSIRELEAVASLDPAEGVEPPPPPQDMPAGTYTFSIAHAGDASSTVEKTVTLTSEGKWRPVSIDAPGLYEISILNADQEKVADLMLLVTPPAQYDEERGKFDALKNAAGSWTGPDARSDEHLLLRAFLLSETHS